MHGVDHRCDSMIRARDARRTRAKTGQSSNVVAVERSPRLNQLRRTVPIRAVRTLGAPRIKRNSPPKILDVCPTRSSTADAHGRPRASLRSRLVRSWPLPTGSYPVVVRRVRSAAVSSSGIFTRQGERAHHRAEQRCARRTHGEREIRRGSAAGTSVPGHSRTVRNPHNAVRRRPRRRRPTQARVSRRGGAAKSCPAHDIGVPHRGQRCATAAVGGCRLNDTRHATHT